MKITKTILLLLSLLVFTSAGTPKFNILIIGDSISIGYTPFVQSSMVGLANVVHNPGNAQSTTNGLEKTDEWIGTKKWDVIQFNWGLWDLAYRTANKKDLNKASGILTNSPEKYRENMEILVKKLLATKAKLIFVTTTYVPVDEPGRKAGDEEVYNAIAIEVMKKHHITINNITNYSADVHQNPAYGLGSDNVHYNRAGYELLAAKISEALKAELKGLTPRELN